MLFILETLLELVITIFAVFWPSEVVRIYDIPRDNWSDGDYFMILYTCVALLAVSFFFLIFLAYFCKHAPIVLKKY